MSAENEAISTITKVIRTACERIIAKASFDKTVRGIVVGVPNKNSDSLLYTVQVNGGRYEVPNYSGTKLNIGKSVLVLIPCNKYENMCIINSCTSM